MRSTIGLLVGVALVTATAAYAQAPTGQIQGTVRDESGAPLGGVSVTVMATRFGGLTGSDGRYTIAAVPPGTYRVRARFIGYGTAEDTSVVVVAGETATADFQLKAQAIQLDAIVAVGYGTQLKKDLTGSVASVSGTDVETNPVQRADLALAGRVPGLQVQTTNAQPDAELRIRVRGGNSLSASNAPLVVIDGVIGADLRTINPADIESFDILKDASATAIYGARGGNGVIMVTTKRGQGPIRFEYSTYVGTQTVSKHIPMLNAAQFALLYMRNPNHDNSITLDTLRPLPTTDWQDVVYRAAPIQNHEIRVRGSSGDTRLMFSANWYAQHGVLVGSDVTRGSVRFNLDQNLGARFRLGTRVSYSRTVANDARVNTGYGGGGGPVTMQALRFAPTLPVRDASGTFSRPLLPSQDDNPMAIIDLAEDKATTGYGIGTLFGEYDVMPGLTLRSSLSLTSRDSLGQRYVSRQLNAALNLGRANIGNRTTTTWLSENTVALHRTLAHKHDFTLLGGFTGQQTNNTTSGSQGEGFTSDELGYNRLNLAQKVTGSSSASRQRLLSFFGRLNYSFAGKYLLTATLRDDGSSKFAANNKWALFPSAAVAWRMSDEPFLRRLLPAVSELKLRLSAGQSGSEAIGSYQSLAAWVIDAPYAIGTTIYNNGARLSRNANPNLRWETTTQYDAGLDLGLFDNRISLTADVYEKTTKDLLYAKLVPYITGFASYVTNIGKIRNRGLEVSLDTRPAVGAVQVRLGGNLSLNRNKVLDLGGDQEFFLAGANTALPNIRDGAIVRVGEPLGNFYGYVFDGIFQDSAQLAAIVQPGARLGGERFKDLDNNDTLDARDRTILGNAVPRYLFGLTGSVGYKGLSLSWMLRGALDFKVVNLNRLGLSTPGASTNMLTSVLNYWTPTHPTNSMTGLGIGPDASRLSSRWIEEGSFVRLQNVTVTWDLPAQFSGRFGMERLRLYLSGQNLFTATRYSWYDPEVSSRGTDDPDLGWDDSSYPGTRTLTVGMNVGF
jgi:TonB-dependent starch-binding outer membrane protein SusC